MSAAPDESEPFVSVGVEALTTDRYDDVTFEDGMVMIYDRENEDAWFQSESAISLDVMA